jgi:hypothetical protein
VFPRLYLRTLWLESAEYPPEGSEFVVEPSDLRIIAFYDCTSIQVFLRIPLQPDSFGKELVFHAQKIGYTLPNLVAVVGLTKGGEKVQLIQHVTQLSLLLKAVAEIGSTANRVTFH